MTCKWVAGYSEVAPKKYVFPSRFLMVLWQTTAINSACSIATVQSSICSREKTVKQQFSSLWQRYVTYLPKPSQSVSPQQMFTEDSAASSSTAPPSRSTSTKPSVPDINAMRDMINWSIPSGRSWAQFLPLHWNYVQLPEGERKEKIWPCMDLSTRFNLRCNNFLFIKEKGMYCLLCRLHQAKGKHNKSASYGMEPAVRFQTSANIRTECVQK